jgi:hypothetical protein
MDMEARKRWHEYSKAKDIMFQYTDVANSPWYVVESDIKKNARINCISHLLEKINYKDIKSKEIVLPEKQEDKDYERTPYGEQNLVPDIASRIASKHFKENGND